MLNTSKSDERCFLGISANTSNQKTKKPNDAPSSKRLKYTVQQTAQSLLHKHGADRQHRTCSCHRNVASDGVPVYRNEDGSGARLSNLITCGSVWACPICNSAITESRRADMQKAQTNWSKQGGSCLLITLTTEHEADQPLHEVLDLMRAAVNDFNNDKTIKKLFGTSVASIKQADDKGKPLQKIIKGQHPRLGYVRSLEVTHGNNGWHPHFHTVMFMDDDKLLSDSNAQELIKAVWVKCLIKNGADQGKLNDLLRNALDIRGGDYVSDYINKFGREPIEVRGWTIAHEVTKANSKIGGRKVNGDFHHTPFQLLGYATDGDQEAGALFREFAEAFEGKRQNYWTNGLKDWFGINEKTEEEIAAEQAIAAEQPAEEFVMRLNTDQWRLVLATNARGELITAAAEYGESGVLRLLDDLATRPKIFHGYFNDQSRPDFSRFYH